MISRLDKALTFGFCVLWATLIFIEYWYYHPYYGSSIEYFQYTDLTLVLGGIGVLVGFGLYLFRNKTKPFILFNGLGVLGLFLLISAITISIHFDKVKANFTTNPTELMTYLGKIMVVLLAVYFIFTTCFALGNLFFQRLFSFSFKKIEGTLLKIATGVTFISIILTLLGAVNLLDIKIIIPIFLVILGIEWKSTLQFLKTTLITPIKASQQLNWLGFIGFYLILIFISLNFLQNIRPLPFGFDALAIYLNLPQLIGENQGLIEGYSPYYWSLFISLGYILFDQIEVVIALSVAGGIFSIITIFAIARKWLDVNLSILTALLLYSLPLINFQSFRDVKTDLGLLFILLTVVLVLIKWLSIKDTKAFIGNKNIIDTSNRRKRKNTKETQETIETTKGVLMKFLSEEIQLIILMGLLSGMAIGIKLTGLILIFGVLCAFSFVKGGRIGFLTGFTLVFAVILLGGLDVATGLRAYHFGTDSLKLIIPILGVAGLAFLFIKKRNGLLDLVRIAAIYLVFAGLVYLPWPIKNYKETNSISINTFITGKPSNLLININQVQRNADAIQAGEE